MDIKKEMTRYKVGLASAPIAGFMVTYNKHTLGLEDLGTLEEQNWLNDQVGKDEGRVQNLNPTVTIISIIFDGSLFVQH